MEKLIVTAILLVFISACSSSEKLAEKGWKKYEEGQITKADKIFSRALLKKGLKERAFEGKAFTAYKFGRYAEAESNIAQAYRVNNASARHTYNYACFSNLNGKPSQAMSLLFEIPAKGDFHHYRKLAASDPDLKSLKNNVAFIRYLSGYRRLKIQPYSAYSDIFDGPFNQNDLFVVVKNGERVILVTNVVQESNYANWSNQFVVFDYPLDSRIRFVLMDEDIFEHDKILDFNSLITKTDDYTFKYGNSYLKVKVSDTELTPQTTGTYLPKEVSLSELILGLGALYLISNAEDLDNSFLTRLIDCSVKAGISYYVENPLQAAVVKEAYASVKEQRKLSFNALSEDAVKGLVVAELRSRGYTSLANAIEVADYARCVFYK